MNTRHFPILCALALMMAASCGKDPQPEALPPVIEAEDVIVPAEAGSASLTYSIQNPVEGQSVVASTTAAWISSFDYSNSGRISFEVDANTSDERSAVVTLSYSGAQNLSVTVTQLAAGTDLALNPETLAFVPDGGTLEVTVVSARAWVMTGESDWVSASATSGDPGETITFTAAANPSDDPRSASFSFICGTNVVPFEVTQSYTGRLIVDKSLYEIVGDANSFSISLQSNVENVSVEVTEGSDWLTCTTTRAMQTYTFDFSATENTADTDRSAIVVFSNRDAAEQVEIRQSPSYPADVLTKVEDSAFRAYLQSNFDTNGDGTITREEAEAVTSIHYEEGDLASAVGIEYFTNLESVNLNYNTRLTSVDLSGKPNLKEVNLNYCTRLESLDLEGSDAIEILNVGITALTSLDLTGKSALREVYAYSISGLSALDVTGAAGLEILNINGTAITSLDLGNNPELVTLSLPDISGLDLTACPKIESLSLNGSYASSVDLSSQTALRSLSCTNCEFTSIDVTMCPDLEYLSFDYCSNLETIDVSKNMKLNTLALYMTTVSKVCMTEGQYIPRMSGVDSSTIEYLPMDYPEDLAAGITDQNLWRYIINEFDLSYVTWDCDNMIDSEENTRVTYLDCPDRGIKEMLGLDYFINITRISAYNNEITAVDFSSQNKLTELNLSNNQLTTIDLSRNPSIETLDLSNNLLTEIVEFPNSSVATCDLSNNHLTSLDASNSTRLTTLDVSGNDLTYLDVWYSTALRTLDCSDNDLTEISIWSLSALRTLNCSNNPLTNLDHTTYLTNLQSLDCSNTDITTLDLRQNVNLTRVIATGCPNLTTVYIGNNEIPTLQVDEGVSIVTD